MKAKLESTDIVSLSLIGGTVAVTAALFARLPDRIPTHFDASGAVDGWMNRASGVAVLPLIALGVFALLRFGSALLPADWRARLERSPTGMYSAAVVAFFCSLQLVILYAALDDHRSPATALGVLLGAFWFGAGLVLPRVRRNPWIGVRTPWTLSSDENWARTHRFAGHVFVVAGALGAIGSIVTRTATPSTFLIIGSALVAAAYSFVLARRLPPET